MNEAAAARTLLVRAYEREPPSQTWSQADRQWATEAAARVEGEEAADDAFIARRAALAVERLSTRDPRVARLLASVVWPAWVGWALPVLAFGLGAAADAVGTGRQVNLLAPPLLALLSWNLAVYGVIVVRGIWGLFDARVRGLGPLARALGQVTFVTGAAPRRAGKVATQFLADWAQEAAGLTAARLGRVLHASAAAFALGALGSLYLRGIAFEYRAGWESTFLDAATVKALLDAVLGPAAALTGIGLPDVDGYEQLRFAAGGANAAPWLHLYAVTVGAAVVLPRLLLALADRWREARLARRFPLPLQQTYFRALVRRLRAEPLAVRIVPYGLQPTAQAALNLQAVLVQAFGPGTTVAIAPTTAYGAEDEAGAAQLAGTSALLALLFPLTATPEEESHGAFVGRLMAAAGTTRVIALVDEAAFVRQFGADSERIGERRALWQQFAAARGIAPVFIDLDRPERLAVSARLQTLTEAPAA